MIVWIVWIGWTQRRKKMGFKPCWSCGSTDLCYEYCNCSKCIDPEAYDEWKYGSPEDYRDWIENQWEDNY